MCGRYAASRDLAELAEIFDVESVAGAEDLPPDYNVAPTKPVFAVMERARGDGVKERHLRTVRWGLVPSWAKDLSGSAKLINARLETVVDKPSFRTAYQRRRCLVPTDGYYEWYADPQAPAKTPKQPYFITPKDGGVLALAGIYEIWRRPEAPPDAADAFVWSMSLLTTSAPDEFGVIHDRMPLWVAPEHQARWLDPYQVGPDPAGSEVLAPAAAIGLTAYPVSLAVNRVANIGPELITPLDNS